MTISSFSQTPEFFRTLYKGQTGVLELRTFGPEESDQSVVAKEQRAASYRLRDFLPVENGDFDYKRIYQFCVGCAKYQLGAFFGVALRTQSSIVDRKGDAAHCQTLTALFVDADFKQADEVTTRGYLAEYAVPPSILVNSGGGLHPYWLLHNPFDLQNFSPHDLLHRLAYSAVATSDIGVSEPIRVLRIPGSLNFKYSPPRAVFIEYLSDKRIYPSELPLIEMKLVGSTAQSGLTLIVPPTVIKGERHSKLRDIMRSLQARGVPLPAILEICHYENEHKCDPVINRQDLDAYLKRVAALPDRPGFKRIQQPAWDLFGSLFEIGLSPECVMTACRAVDPKFTVDPMSGTDTEIKIDLEQHRDC